MGVIARSQLIRIEWFALAAVVGFENPLDDPLQLIGVRFGGSQPPLVCFDFVQHESGEQILPIRRHLPQPLDRVF
jgi:hypothetical protein